MMASFRKRKDKWQARIQKKGYPVACKSFKKLIDAKCWANKVEREYDLDIYDSPKSMITLKDALSKYLKEVTPFKKRPKIESYRIHAWQKTSLSNKFLNQIKTSDLVPWRDHMISSNYQPNTIRLHLAVLSHLYTIAQSEWGFENVQNPVKNLCRPRLISSTTKRITDKDIQLLIKNTYSPDLPLLIQLGLLSGMRRSELIKLHWQDIDWEREIIYLKNTKNGDTRRVPLFKSIKKLLKPRIKHQGKIFSIAEQAVTVAFRRACFRSNLKNISFHSLRHEAITRFFEQGLTIPEVAFISGHKSWSMLRRYTHLDLNLHKKNLE